jgi:hypothetical protein
MQDVYFSVGFLFYLFDFVQDMPIYIHLRLRAPPARGIWMFYYLKALLKATATYAAGASRWGAFIGTKELTTPKQTIQKIYRGPQV